ncbi:MAG: DUF559 domain-containing protein [Chloroflexi bacterium]|nr:DUF559 domain-containing protein [Chloroflexota bacterium]
MADRLQSISSAQLARVPEPGRVPDGLGYAASPGRTVIKTGPAFGGRSNPVGSKVVDFYVPSHHLAIEVDSWGHRRRFMQERDKKRDAWLLEHHNLPVIRLTHKEIEAVMREAI